MKPGRLVISTKIGIKKYASPEEHQADLPFETTIAEDAIELHMILDLLKERNGLQVERKVPD